MSQEDVTRTESIEEQERARAAEADKKPKSRRPASTLTPPLPTVPMSPPPA